MDTLSENWSVIENNYFIKYHFFNMSWTIADNFKDHLIAYEPNGGAIAVISRPPLKQELMVYSASGRIISSKVWQDAAVIGIYWSENENVLLLQKSGRVAVYTLQSEYVMYAGMGDAVKQNLVKSFRFFTSFQGIGLMVITENNDCYFKTNVVNMDSVIKNIKISKMLSSVEIVDWLAFTDLSDRETVAVLVSRNELIKVKYKTDPQIFGDGSRWFSTTSTIKKLAISKNHKNLSMVMSDGKVWLIKSDLSHPIANYNFDFKIDDKGSLQMEWAGEDFLVVYYDQCLYLMDTSTQSTNVFYLDNPLLFAEIDGVRLITPTKHEFIQKIPHELEQLCELGEDCPAAWLFDAQRHLDNKSPDAINYLEQVLRKEGQLEKAINVCLLAATYCLEPKWQKVILSAVRLGRSYLPQYKSDRVSDIHGKLTLLNNLNLPFIAMPLTITQLEHLTMPVLLDRLCNRRYYPFIERLCQRLRIPKDHGINRMLEYWAENFILRQDDEDVIATKLIERLQSHSDFRFAKIAEVACNMKKFILAEKLLEKESRIERQVEIWLKLKKNSLALTRSIESGNTDLISCVVSNLGLNMHNQEFIMLICKYPVAKSIYIEHLVMSENSEWTKSKKSLDEMEDNPSTRAENQLKAALQTESLQSSLSVIISAQDQFRKLSNDSMVQIMDDQKMILQHQMATFRETGFDSGEMMSLRSYLQFLFEHNLDEKAESLKQKMKVSDRQFYWLRLETYAKQGLWDDFDRLIAKWNRRVLVTFHEIADICVSHDNEVQVNKYLDRVEPTKRVKLLVKMNRLQEAEDLARSIRDDYLIHYVSAMKFNI